MESKAGFFIAQLMIEVDSKFQNRGIILDIDASWLMDLSF